jgi:hypothetical protein
MSLSIFNILDIYAPMAAENLYAIRPWCLQGFCNIAEVIIKIELYNAQFAELQLAMGMLARG